LLMLSSTPSLVPVLRFCPRSFFSTIPAPTHIYTLSLHDALPISLMLSFASWRSIFVVTGALGLAWTLWWRRDYFPPEEHPRLGDEERAQLRSVVEARPASGKELRWPQLLRIRQTLGPATAKFLSAAAW